MAHVALPLDERPLPAICVKSGVPADVQVASVVRVRPRWVGFLLPLSFVGWLVARSRTASDITVHLPWSSRALARSRRATRVATAVVAAGAVLFLGNAAAVHRLALAEAALAVVSIGVVLLLVVDLATAVGVDANADGTVVIRRASRRFVAAVEAQGAS
jgi:hypothetical protein